MSGFEIPLIAGALSLGGSALSAFGKIEAGEAAQQAGQITASNTLAAAKYASETHLASADLLSKLARQGGELEAQGATRQGDVIAEFATGRAQFSAAVRREGASKAADALRQGGILSQQAAYLAATAAEREATDERAMGARAALDRRRETELTQSSLQARAAASGGSASDQTVQKLAGDIAERGEYNVLSELYIGESRARGFLDTAAQHRFSGDAARYGAELQRSATLFVAESEARAAEYEGAATAAAAKIEAHTKAALSRYRSEATAVTATFEGEARSKAALMEGSAKAQAALFAGNNAASAANISAFSTILGGAGSVFSDTAKATNNFKFS
jgi:hypothetical protein